LFVCFLLHFPLRGRVGFLINIPGRFGRGWIGFGNGRVG
jgi:hypothetical protein